MRFGTADPYFSHHRVCEKFDVPHALLQFIKDRDAALEQRVAVDRRLDAERASVEQPDAESMLQIGDHFRYGRLGDAQLLRRLAHAAALDNREKHMQIAQLEPATHLLLPIDPARHRGTLMSA